MRDVTAMLASLSLFVVLVALQYGSERPRTAVRLSGGSRLGSVGLASYSRGRSGEQRAVGR